ncbi:hypothetical protein NL676_035146 [Syzygium grande]|nr:hypothetical protein NL676_035146 [Syzygium grande]
MLATRSLSLRSRRTLLRLCLSLLLLLLGFCQQLQVKIGVGGFWEEGLTEAAVSSGIHERREEIVICRDPIVEREGKGE